MNIDVEDAIALIGLLQHDTLGSNTLSVPEKIAGCKGH